MSRCVLDRFWGKVEKNGPTLREGLSPCWAWTAGKYPNGYGKFFVGGAVATGAQATQMELSARFNISRSVVCGIVRGQLWRHVTQEYT